MSNEIWNSLVKIFKNAENPKRDGRTIIGEYSSDDTNDSLTDFIDIENNKITIYEDHIHEKLSGHKIYLTKKLYKNITKDKVFIFEGKLSSEDFNDRAYFDGLKWYNEFLEKIKSEEIADCVTDNIIYFHEDKGIKFPLTIPFEHLHKFSSQDNLLNKVLVNDHHQSEKISIFKQMLIDILVNIPEAKRPAELVEKSSTFLSLFEESYNIYLTDFRVNKILKDIKEKHLEFIGKLQSLVIDTGNKLVIIPTAYILLGTQNQKITSLLSNEIAIAGAFLFSITLIVMLIIQWLNICSIKKIILEYKQEKIQLVPSKKEEIENRFNLLVNILCFISFLTWVFIFVSAFLCLIAFKIFPIAFNKT